MALDRYITPFSNGLWLAVVIAACVLCVCLALTNFSNKSNDSLSLIATVFYIIPCFCQQGKKAKHICALFILSCMLFPGHVVAQWLRKCASNLKTTGSIPDCVTGIFH
jgi:hypothetical protein